ncbi:cobalamin-dependent protein [Geobacter pelophilus]|uniref:Cobalamin-dependent protein n=1 Tax=Geoanaerobacter pelophilus TaxID=60036 RepID=A0AAW4L2Q3_9BACT|nr:radical SAM protein [Geoanaerobacter pelophilus]MBT0665009.1 cobalamin-dependent protein [Geoanaerobacter pelophilus]
MRVLLIQPPSSDPLMDQVYLFEPLALEYLGAGLKLDGHEVELLDARLDPDPESACNRFQPDLVGLTGFTSHVNIIKQLATRLKTISPELLIIVGGHHATVQPEEFNVPDIDVVVIGEGVFTLREIVRAVEQGSGFSEIKGLALPCPDGMIYSEPRPYTDLNALPCPDRGLTAGYRQHYFSEWFKPLASIRTSLGCTARCNFCALWGITGGKYLRRDPEAVVAELKTIAEPNIFFCDDESMCDVKRMDRLADLIREAGIKKNFFLYGRVDTIVNHAELFAKWAKIGLAQVFVGMEDFSDERLAAMNKGVTSAQQIQAAKILDDLGIMMYASFMVDPAYRREDFRSLIVYVRRLRLKYATFTVMTPLPGTALHKEREQEILSRKPELYDMLHALLPTTLPLEEFYRELANLYTNAVPFYRVLPALYRFGMHGLLLRIRLFGRILAKIKAGHLDY